MIVLEIIHLEKVIKTNPWNVNLLSDTTQRKRFKHAMEYMCIYDIQDNSLIIITSVHLCRILQTKNTPQYDCS